MMKILRKPLRWLLLFVLLIIFVTWFLLVAIDRPPEVSDKSALEAERQQAGDNIYFVGNNWLRRSETGLWEMYIEGDDFERGVAFGKLTKELLLYQETAFFEQIQELVPSFGYLRFLKYFLSWFDRNLDRNITEEYKREIYGISFSCSPEYRFIGSDYQRQLHYHAAHDIGHALQGLNMVGCTSFSCWGGKSADSTIITGRNFDFFAGKKFAENKIVCFYNPARGHKFMMITWADMIGVVSGMNEKGLTITINAAKSSIPLKASTPVSLVAREILQYASNIDEAYSIAVKRKMFVSESLLISSVADGKSAVIEKSPKKHDIVYPEGDQIVCSNHFQGEVFRNDKRNIENIRGSDSQQRFDRVTELLKDKNSVSVSDAVDILRNREGVGNKALGMGNPMAINQLIAHHAVVFKPARQIAWVSSDPYQLGRFVAYDLKKIFSLTKEEIISNHEIYTSELTIPSDEFLGSEEYKNFKRFQEMTIELRKISVRKKPLPPAFEENYIASNPEYYLTWSRLGDYWFRMKEYNKAYKYYQGALSKEVSGEDIRKNLIKLSDKSFIKSKNAGN